MKITIQPLVCHPGKQRLLAERERFNVALMGHTLFRRVTIPLTSRPYWYSTLIASTPPKVGIMGSIREGPRQPAPIERIGPWAVGTP